MHKRTSEMVEAVYTVNKVATGLSLGTSSVCIANAVRSVPLKGPCKPELPWLQAYLSLPDGAASAEGLIAMMTDHYNILVCR